MTFVSHPRDRQRTSLSLEQEPLGEGGQGVVTRVVGAGPLVYKEYMPQAGTVNDAALTDLVDFGHALPDSERRLLFDQCAWPMARVCDGDRVTGFLMREAPGEFLGPINGASKLIEVQYLLFLPNHTWQSLHQPDITGRVEIALAATRLIDLLHGHGFVLGDISFRNLLWRPALPYRLFVLDCDGFRRHGGEPVLRQAHTPDWDDPLQPSTGPDLDTDRYKLALLVGRILARDAHVRPGKTLTLLPGLKPQTAEAVAELFARAQRPHGSRPMAKEWLQALIGRKWIAVNRPQPRRLPEPIGSSASGTATGPSSHPPRGSVPVSRPPMRAASQGTPSTPPRNSVPVSRPPMRATSQGTSSTPPRKSIPASPPSVRSGPQAASSPPTKSIPVSSPSRSLTLGERVTASDAFASQPVSPGGISAGQVALLLDALEARGGHLAVTEVAALIGEPVDRTRLLMVTAKRLLNLDSLDVLTLKDGDQAVDLNLGLLKEQFLDEEVEP
ncbi:hypothetical protein ABT061_04175 [Streptosporangium sp. NPDC002544]|uniref:hypothetical protein n=1 Tax=Streptosporangium sp. NPDC002544 TaxID=3154538 RepID=UPI003333F478